MSKWLAFGGGMVAGAVALTAAVTTIPPVRKQAAKGIAAMIMFAMENNPEAQEQAVELAKQLIKDYEEK